MHFQDEPVFVYGFAAVLSYGIASCLFSVNCLECLLSREQLSMASLPQTKYNDDVDDDGSPTKAYRMTSRTKNALQPENGPVSLTIQ
jgi:hypothetical protein